MLIYLTNQLVNHGELQAKHKQTITLDGLQLVLDEATFECTQPQPAKDAVSLDLSFTQARKCEVQAKKSECFDYQDQRVCVDKRLSVTLSNHEVGSKL